MTLVFAVLFVLATVGWLRVSQEASDLEVEAERLVSAHRDVVDRLTAAETANLALRRQVALLETLVDEGNRK